MAYLHITVDTPNKSYTGIITMAANSTLDDAKESMKTLIGGINSVESLSIENEGAATIFSKTLLAESVITVKAME